MNNMLKTYRTMELLLLDILEKLYMKYSNTSSWEKLHAASMQFFLCLKTRQISKKQVKILLNIMIVCAEQHKSYGQ